MSTSQFLSPPDDGIMSRGSPPPHSLRALHIADRLPPPKPPTPTPTRLCGSGFETVINGAEAMELDQAEVALAAGTENMSAAPFVVDGNAVRWGVPLGKGPEMKDSLWAGLTDSLAGTPMGITAENLGAKYGITRAQCDEYAFRSQQLWLKAKEAGVFDGACVCGGEWVHGPYRGCVSEGPALNIVVPIIIILQHQPTAEVAPVEVQTKKGVEVMTTDEHPRPSTELAKMGKLAPVFKKEGCVRCVVIISEA